MQIATPPAMIRKLGSGNYELYFQWRNDMYGKRLILTAAALYGLSWASLGTAHADDQHPIKDSYITTKVKSELVSDIGKRALHVSVKTQDGVVALTGHVDSADAKERAERDAKRIKGVVGVINKIDVQP